MNSTPRIAPAASFVARASSIERRPGVDWCEALGKDVAPFESFLVDVRRFGVQIDPS